MPKKIIIAEDEAFLSKVMASKLKKEGFEVIVCEDGEECLSAIRSQKPDLVLLDLLMPKKDGFAVLEEVRSDKDIKETKFIITSNLGQESDVEKGKKLGALEYIVKANNSIHEIVAIVKKYL
jgi:DNA-binding response OmpR family regulator